jgi:hypothetical protein
VNLEPVLRGQRLDNRAATERDHGNGGRSTAVALHRPPVTPQHGTSVLETFPAMPGDARIWIDAMNRRPRGSPGYGIQFCGRCSARVGDGPAGALPAETRRPRRIHQGLVTRVSVSTRSAPGGIRTPNLLIRTPGADNSWARWSRRETLPRGWRVARTAQGWGHVGVSRAASAACAENLGEIRAVDGTCLSIPAGHSRSVQ